MDTQYDIVRADTLASTQDEAKRRMVDAGKPVLVIAERQTGGRGRQGREWIQPDRGLFTSFSFESDWEPGDRTLIPLVAAVAMRASIDDVLDVAIGLRWPNDLMVEAAKVGGVLVEASDDVLTVGCGLNLWWAAPIAGAGSLLSADPAEYSVVGLASVWADTLVAYLSAGSNRWPRAAYEAASVTLGHEVVWDGGSGTARAIASDGALVVDTATGPIELRAGEVHTRR
ncbi:MAG: biotin--[acetyl-CoA-carboxylase] ligase [Actinomycetota bacterium]